MTWTWNVPGERIERRHFSPKVPKNEPVVQPELTDPAAADAAEAEARKVASKRKGRSSTILTSPSGAKLADSGNTTASSQKTLGVR